MTNNGQLSSYVTDGVTNTLTYDEEIYIALVHGVTYDMTDAYLIPSVTKKKLFYFIDGWLFLITDGV